MDINEMNNKIIELRNVIKGRRLEISRQIKQDGIHLYKTIGKNIKNVRTLKGYTQEDFAFMMGFERTSIVHIENGKQKLPIDKLLYMSKLLDVKLIDLIDDNEEPQPQQTEE